MKRFSQSSTEQTPPISVLGTRLGTTIICSWRTRKRVQYPLSHVLISTIQLQNLVRKPKMSRFAPVPLKIAPRAGIVGKFEMCRFSHKFWHPYCLGYLNFCSGLSEPWALGAKISISWKLGFMDVNQIGLSWGTWKKTNYCWKKLLERKIWKIRISNFEKFLKLKFLIELVTFFEFPIENWVFWHP